MSDERKKALAEAESIARRVAEGLGLEIVEFVFHSQGKHSQLRIDIDRAGVPGAGLADCEAHSRALDAPLEQVEFIGGGYEFQVSTPGIDRPIRSDDDLRRNTGRPVRAEVRDADGRVREIHGTLGGAAGADRVRLLCEGEDMVVARDRILLMKQDVTLGRRPRPRR